MTPEHHRGMIILRHRKRPVAVSLEASWFMSLPKAIKDKYAKEWDIIRVCN